jgi:hypothetical protein
MAEKASVPPSAAARATASIASVPPAPGRCSTITGTPSWRVSTSASARATSLLSPPTG